MSASKKQQNNKMELSGRLTTEKIFCFICFAIVTLILIAPLCNKGQISGHDVLYHTARIEALKQQILDGNPFSRINYFFYQGEGYASSICYPDLLLYIPALFRVAGLNVNLSYNIFLMLCGVACYITTFYAAKEMTKSSYAATICAALFSLSQYHLDNILTRGAVGEIQAFIFIPLLVYGIYNYLYEDFSHPIVMGAGFIGLVLSHTITTFLIIIVYAILMLINIKKILKAPKNLIKLCVTAGCVLLCTCFYWIPLLELMAKMDLKVSHSTRVVAESAVLFKYLFTDIKMSLAEQREIGMGISVFMLLILRVTIKKSNLISKSKKSDVSEDNHNVTLLRAADTFAITGLVITFCSTELFPWKLFTNTPLNSIQFAWRLFIVAAVFLSFSSCIYLMLLLVSSKAKKTLPYSIVACIICILGFVHTQTAAPSYKHRENDYFYQTGAYLEEFDNTCRTGGSEWLPYPTSQNKKIALRQSSIVKDQMGSTYKYEKDGSTVTVEINNSDSSIKTIQVPLVYYVGYNATFTDANGKESILDIHGTLDCGLCEVNIPSASEGTLKVYYKGTALQKISFAITMLTVTVLIALLVYTKIKKKSRSNTEEV